MAMHSRPRYRRWPTLTLTPFARRHLAGKAKPPPPPQRVKQDSAVLTLSERSFDQALSEHDVILVEFYAPWCAHCKRLAPDYERAASTLQKAGTPVALAKIDATMERGPTARFAIQGYPTLRECELVSLQRPTPRHTASPVPPAACCLCTAVLYGTKHYVASR
jgi:protein disulfide-isomerase-like protein